MFMDTKLNPKSQVLEALGGLSVVFGLGLGISCFIPQVGNVELYLAPSREGVMALGLYFMFVGIGVCCHMRLAAILLVPGLLWVAGTQIYAAYMVQPWSCAFQHVLLALFPGWPLLLLWRHRKELR